MRAAVVDGRLEAIAGPLVTSWRNGQPRQVVQVPAGATIITLIGGQGTTGTYAWERFTPARRYAYIHTTGTLRTNVEGVVKTAPTPTAWHTAVNEVTSEYGIGGRATVTTEQWTPNITAGVIVTHATLTPHQAKQTAIWLAKRLKVPLPPQL